jgi:hypothetical protein
LLEQFIILCVALIGLRGRAAQDTGGQLDQLRDQQFRSDLDTSHALRKQDQIIDPCLMASFISVHPTTVRTGHVGSIPGEVVGIFH